MQQGGKFKAAALAIFWSEEFSVNKVFNAISKGALKESTVGEDFLLNLTKDGTPKTSAYFQKKTWQLEDDAIKSIIKLEDDYCSLEKFAEKGTSDEVWHGVFFEIATSINLLEEIRERISKEEDAQNPGSKKWPKALALELLVQWDKEADSAKQAHAKYTQTNALRRTCNYKSTKAK
jgi:hypothetical protein